MMNEITVYKHDEKGREVWSYPASLLKRGENCLQVEAYFDRDYVDLGPAVLERGDRFVETFYSDRWYNVFSVYSVADGSHKGWYCNVTRPAHIDDHSVRSDDLALDVWVTAQGDVTVMDEDEFAELELPDSERRRARRALQEIVTLAGEGNLPY